MDAPLRIHPPFSWNTAGAKALNLISRTAIFFEEQQRELLAFHLLARRNRSRGAPWLLRRRFGGKSL
jgi:hypothetical protein